MLKDRVWFSDKTNNWLQNRGDGTFEQAIKQIKKWNFYTRFYFKKLDVNIKYGISR